MTTTVKADAATLLAAWDIFLAAFEPLDRHIENTTSAFVLQAYPTSLLEKCDNSLGPDPKQGPLITILLEAQWPFKDDDDIVIQTTQSALRKMEEVAAFRGTAVSYKTMKYAYSSQDPIASYGSANHENLRAVSRAYDAMGLFQKGVPGGFKLGMNSE
jgi:hypothetical protein